MNKSLSLITIIFVVFSGLAQEAESYFEPLKYRHIGPFRGGRSVASSGVIEDPLTYYMGTTGGGLWKTEDAGQHWNNISDGFFKTGSVGAVAVSESNSNIIYVGMGEHAIRGVMTSFGDGVYKSTDAGKTWKHLGLEKTQQISRIVIHPTNPDIVYVAAQGAIYGPTEDRGIYKSTDGGKTWKNVLYVNELTGGVELSMDMNYPEIMYAAMWHHQRTPWKIISGGEGSGLYKSVDAGETWTIIHEGLPEEKGKMAISVCRSNSSKLYALIESDSNKDLGGLFVSNDSGENWNRISDDNRLTQRAWYYTEVFSDPNNENVVYVLSAPALRSIDGGKTWETLGGTHGDFHDLWINPANSNNMVISNDGGAAISFNNGKSWSTQSNMPIAQIYRINADNLYPYNIYGGQQDYPSLKIASLSFGNYQITESDWSNSAGGESAFLAFDPDNPEMVLGGSYLGTIEALNTKTNTGTKIMAAPIEYLGRQARDMKYLYNWNAPIIWSKHEPGTYYHCAQVVLKTKDMGVNWEEISPDLTRNIDEKQGNGGGPYTNEAVGAENYGTISYMVESPQEIGVFYTGSDDGLVHITKDNGKTWQNITPKGIQQCLINAIEVSPHDAATAYIATTRYKFNDYTPAIYKTTNYGETWVNISNNLPYGSFTRVIREDPIRKNLLYAGTEGGIYISWNAGKYWESIQLNLPKTPITDLKLHNDDLIVSTSGRGFWVLDDVTLLSQYRKTDISSILYQPEKTYNGNWGSQLSSTNPKFDGTSVLSGVNPAFGVVIYYELPKLEDSTEVVLEILNSKNDIIRSFSTKKDNDFSTYAGGPSPEPLLSKKEGLNRFVWNMRQASMPGATNVYIEASYRGHVTPPGDYELILKFEDTVINTTCTIEKNPLYKDSFEEYQAYDSFMKTMENNVTDMHNKVNALYGIQNQLSEVIGYLKKNSKNETLSKSGEALLKKLKKWDEEMVQRKSKAYDDVENFPNKFTANYLFLLNQSDNILPKINQSSIDRKIELDKIWQGYRIQAETFINDEIPAFNKQLWEAGVGALRMN